MPLDELSPIADTAFVFGSSDVVERLAEVPQDREFVAHDGRLRRVMLRRMAKRLPRVQHGEFDFIAVLFA